MELRLGNPPAEIDASPLLTLEIRPELATEIEDRLGVFADECELDTALVVARSGALVAGISVENGVTIQAVAALVAQAGGNARTLAHELKNRAPLESLFFGEDRLLYLRELDERFFLVAVAPSTVPVGVVRAAAGPLVELLLPMLVGILVPMPLPERPVSLSKSLRRIALERAPLSGGSKGAARSPGSTAYDQEDPFSPIPLPVASSTAAFVPIAQSLPSDSVFEMEDDEDGEEAPHLPSVPVTAVNPPLPEVAPRLSLEPEPVMPEAVLPLPDATMPVFELDESDDEDEDEEEYEPEGYDSTEGDEPLSSLGEVAPPTYEPEPASPEPTLPPATGSGPYYF